MKNKMLKRIACTLAAILFWLLIWEIVARSIDVSFILPNVKEIFLSLISLLGTAKFYKTVILSFLRILAGFAIGTTLGVSLAPLTKHVALARVLLSPAMTVIRATPVASFIMALWLLIGSDAVPTTITALMVTPIVWQSMTEALGSVDGELDEVCRIYKIRGFKRFRILMLPTIIKFLVPSIITSAGLAWKSGIAAEIIAYTANSIGKEIYLAKAYLESGEMLAWTLVVVLLSLIFETLLTLLGRRSSKWLK